MSIDRLARRDLLLTLSAAFTHRLSRQPHDQATSDSDLVPILVIVGPLVASIAAATLLHRLVEKPSLRLAARIGYRADATSVDIKLPEPAPR
jgi:peptidoglycan/LPS O-acetylase OafA/YrhL